MASQGRGCSSKIRNRTKQADGLVVFGSHNEPDRIRGLEAKSLCET